MSHPINSTCAIFLLYPATSSHRHCYQPASVLYLPQWLQIVLCGIYAVELSLPNHESSQRINTNPNYAATPFLAWLTPSLGPPSDFIRLLFQTGYRKTTMVKCPYLLAQQLLVKLTEHFVLPILSQILRLLNCLLGVTISSVMAGMLFGAYLTPLLALNTL